MKTTILTFAILAATTLALPRGEYQSSGKAFTFTAEQASGSERYSGTITTSRRPWPFLQNMLNHSGEWECSVTVNGRTEKRRYRVTWPEGIHGGVLQREVTEINE